MGLLEDFDAAVQKAKDEMIAEILADCVKELPANPIGLQGLINESTATVRAATNKPIWAESKATNE